MIHQPFRNETFCSAEYETFHSQESKMTCGSLDELWSLIKENVAPTKMECAANHQSDEQGAYWSAEVSSDEQSDVFLDQSDSSDSRINFECLEVEPLASDEEEETLLDPLFDFTDLFPMDWKTKTSTEASSFVSGITTSGSKPKIAGKKTTTKSWKSLDEPHGLLSNRVCQEKTKRTRKIYDAPFGQRVYFELTPHDVGLGRGGEMNRHPGNLRFHEVKRKMQPRYKLVPKDRRTDIAQELVDQVHQWGGRFLKNDKIGYYEVHEHTARTKCSQALRETYSQEERAAKRERFRQLRKQQKH